MKTRFKIAEEVFYEQNGILRTSQAKELGIDPKTLSEMVQDGRLSKLSRGIYRLSDLPPLADPDLVTIALRVPKAVVCLISALAYYELTTQIPHRVYIALPRNIKEPKIDYPPIDVTWLSENPYQAGIQEIILDGVNVRIYSQEKTITDCFKFRNKIGLDVALEALNEYLQRPKRNISEVLYFAKINRVKKVMTPYLEAML